MSKRETFEQEKKRVQAMSEREFEAMCRARWEKWQAKSHQDDCMPFVEYYDEQCATYERTPKYN